MGNDLTNIGTIAIGSNTANKVFQINERLTWVKGRHQFKFGGSLNQYTMERYYSGNNGQLGFIQYNGALEVHNSLLNVVLHDNPHLRSKED